MHHLGALDKITAIIPSQYGALTVLDYYYLLVLYSL